MITPKIIEKDSVNQANNYQHKIQDILRMDKRVKQSISAIKGRLKAVKDKQCGICPVLEEQVQRQQRLSKEKDKQIFELNLKNDRILQQYAPYAGPHSARKAGLQAKRDALVRNTNLLFSARKQPIQEIYRIEERLPQEQEQLRSIEEKTQLLRSREKKDREVIKRLSSASKTEHFVDTARSKKESSRQEDEDSYLKDEKLQSFKQRLAGIESIHDEELISEFQGASFTTINEKYNGVNSLIEDLKTSNETLTSKNAFLEKEVNRLKEQLIEKDAQLIFVSEEKLAQEKQLTAKLMSFTASAQQLQSQHKGCSRNIEYYQSRITSLEETLRKDRQQFEQQLSMQTEQLMAAMSKASQWQRARNEREELRGQLKEEALRKLTLIEQINMLNKENYALKLAVSSNTQQMQLIVNQNQQLKKLLSDRGQEIKTERSGYSVKLVQSEKIRSDLEALCYKLQQENEALKVNKPQLEDREIEFLAEKVKIKQEKLNKAIDELRIKQKEVSSNQKIVQKLKSQIVKLNKSLDQQISATTMAESDNKTVHLQFIILKQKYEDLSNGIDETIKTTEKQLEIYSDQLSGLIAENQSLKDQNIKKQENIKIINYKMSQLLEENFEQKTVIDRTVKNSEETIKKLSLQLKQSLKRHQEELAAKNNFISSMDSSHKNNQNLLANVNQKLTAQLKSLQSQNIIIKDKNESLESQLLAQKQRIQDIESRYATLQEDSLIKLQSIQRQRIQDSQLLQEYLSKNNQLYLKIKQLENQLSKKQQQMSELRMQTQSFQQDIESHKSSISELSIVLNNERQNGSQLTQIIQMKQQQLASKVAENQAKIKLLQDSLDIMSQSHENQLNFLIITKERLEQQVSSLQEQLQKQKNNQKTSKRIERIQEQIDNIKQQNMRLKKQLEDSVKEKESITAVLSQKDIAIQELKNSEQSLKKQLSKAYEMQQNHQSKLLQDYKQQIKSIKQSQAQVNNKMEELNRHLNQIRSQNQSLLQKQIAQESQISINRKLILQYEDKILLYVQQIEHLSVIIKENDNQNEQLIKKIDQQTIIINIMNTESQTKDHLINQLKNKIEQLQSQKIDINRKYEELNKHREQVERMIQKTSSKSEENDTAISFLKSQLESKKQQILQQEAQITSTQNHLNEVLQLYSQLKRQSTGKIQSLQRENQTISIKIDQIKRENQKLRQFLEILTKNKQQSEEKCKLFQDQIERYQKELEQMSEDIMQYTEKERSQTQILIQLKQKYQETSKTLQNVLASKSELQLSILPKAQKQSQSLKQLQINYEALSEKYSQSQVQLQEIKEKLMKTQQSYQQQQENHDLLINKNYELTINLSNQVNELKIQLQNSQTKLQEAHKTKEDCQQLHANAIQMLQQQVHEREVQIESKDKRYEKQVTKCRQRIDSLQKELKQTKRLLQVEVDERQTYIVLKQNELERVTKQLSSQIQTLKRESQLAKRILQAELVERQTEISNKDIQINQIESKNAEERLRILRETQQAKSLLQKEIEERQIQINQKDIRISQIESRAAKQLQNVSLQFEEAKCLLQEQIIQRQAEIVECQLKFNEQIQSTNRQKDSIIAELKTNIQKLQLLNTEHQDYINELKDRLSLSLAENDSLKITLNNTHGKLQEFQRQIERLTKSHEAAQSQSQQTLSKIKNLGQSLVQKQNIILDCLAENETTLSLALESVQQKQPSQVEAEKEELLLASKLLPQSQIKEKSVKSVLEDDYKMKSQQLQQNVKDLKHLNESLIQQAQDLRKRQHELNNSVDALVKELVSRQQELQNSNRLNFEHELKIDLLEKDLTQAQVERNQSQQKLQSIKNQYKQQNQKLKNQLEGLSRKLAEVSSEVQAKEQEIVLLRSDKQKIENNLNSKEQQFYQLNVRILKAQREFEQQAQQLFMCKNKIQQFKAHEFQQSLKLQEKNTTIINLQEELKKYETRYNESQAQLLKLEEVFINHKIALEELKIENTTLKERLQEIQQKNIENKALKDSREIIDQNQEFIEELIDNIVHRYESETLSQDLKLQNSTKKLDQILQQIKILRERQQKLIQAKNQSYSLKNEYDEMKNELQKAKQQINNLIKANEQIQKSLTIEELSSGQLILDKDQQISRLREEIKELTKKSESSSPSKEGKGKLLIKPVTSFKFDQHEHKIQQTPQKQLESQFSLIDPLRSLAESPKEEEEVTTLPTEQDVFNLILLYFGGSEDSIHELRHQYKQLLSSKLTILQFIQKLLVAMKKKYDLQLQESKKQLNKVRSDELIAPPTSQNVPIQALLDKSSNSSQKKLPVVESPIIQIEQEDGQAPIIQFKSKSNSEKKKSLLLIHDLNEAISDSQKNDEIQEIMQVSSPQSQDSHHILQHKSESDKLIRSQLSQKSSKSAKEADHQYSTKIKNSLMLSKLRKKK